MTVGVNWVEERFGIEQAKEMIEMQELIERIVKMLVDYPEEINIRAVEGEGMTVYELQVAKSDMGKIIGKKGQMAQAIRTILNAAGRKVGKHVLLEIIE